MAFALYRTSDVSSLQSGQVEPVGVQRTGRDAPVVPNPAGKDCNPVVSSRTFGAFSGPPRRVAFLNDSECHQPGPLC